MENSVYRKTTSIGDRFNLLVILDRVGTHPSNGPLWLCQCDCGGTKIVDSKSLRRGDVKSCGCLSRKYSTSPVSIGDVYGNLLITEQIKEHGKSPVWICRCQCGSIQGYSTGDLVSGKKADCGCSAKKESDDQMIGRRFGILTVIDSAGRLNGRSAWNCQCDCGELKVFTKNKLEKGSNKSCGCLIAKNCVSPVSVGQRYGKLTVIQRKESVGKSNWVCQCDCGGRRESVTSTELTTGRTVDCGCGAVEEKINELVGQRVGRLLVGSYAGRKGSSNDIHYNVVCDCGTEKTVRRSELLSGETKSCGCLRKEVARMVGEKMSAEAITGENCTSIKSGDKFGLLTVIEHHSYKKPYHYWLCGCECGNTHTVQTSALINGFTQSCGCLRVARHMWIVGKKFSLLTVESFSRSLDGNLLWNVICDCGNNAEESTTRLTSGTAYSCGQCEKKPCNIKSHGLSQHPLYSVWRGMMDRCYKENSTNYSYYGGRGISVCEKWQSVENFFDDMLEGYCDGLSIDRIDTNGNYTPENCRWTDGFTQANNRRNNVCIEHNGETLTISQWARKLGVSGSLLYYRIKSGWEIEDAFYKPSNKTIIQDENKK